MAIVKHYVDGTFYAYIPQGVIFTRERNYLTIESDGIELYIKIKSISFIVGGVTKTINIGGYDIAKSGKLSIDVSPYYNMVGSGSTITIGFSYYYDDDYSTRIDIPVNVFDCYSPFLEFVPERCGDAPYARIVPPNRMLWDGKKSTTSMLAAVREDDYFSGYEYEMDGVPYATYRPSDVWLTEAQKNAHLGETYRNTLKSTGNLADLDSNGNPLWIEQDGLLQNVGATFGEQRFVNKIYCRTKTLFVNYNGLTIGAMPDGYRYYVFYYDKNKTYKVRDFARNGSVTLNNAENYPYIALMFDKLSQTAITPSELVGITSSTLTNPEAGKSYRWVEKNGVFSWIELTEEQIVNNSFYWNIYTDGINVPENVDLVNEDFVFSKTFEAFYVRIVSISQTSKKYYRVASVKRVVSLADGSLPYVYIRWKTPWGITVEHLFYLGSYSSDKADAKELESVNYYEELSKHVRVGSFYLDGIVQPYDLFYYKTLENAELVEMYFPSYAFKPATYMPNGDTYVAIKIKGSDVAEAVVDGVAQRIINFKFELS